MGERDHLGHVRIFLQDWIENLVGSVNWAFHLSMALYQPNTTEPKSCGIDLFILLTAQRLELELDLGRILENAS